MSASHNDQPALRDAVEQIKQTAKAASDLLDGLLSFSRVGTSEDSGTQSTFALAGLGRFRIRFDLRVKTSTLARCQPGLFFLGATLQLSRGVLGGKLEIRAKFPAGEVKIKQFGELARRRRLRTRRSRTSSR